MNQEKTIHLKEIIEKLHSGATPESVKEEFLREFGSVSAEDLAAVEKKLMDDGMELEQVQKLCDVHAYVFEDNLQANRLTPSQAILLLFSKGRTLVWKFS